jgi:hypothetical protein
VLGSFPGLQTDVLTFLGDRIGETITGETASVVVGIYGDDLEILDAKAREVRSAIAGVPGAVDVRQGSAAGMPGMEVELRPDRLAQFGFKPVEVLDAVQTGVPGSQRRGDLPREPGRGRRGDPRARGAQGSREGRRAPAPEPDRSRHPAARAGRRATLPRDASSCCTTADGGGRP